MIESNFSSFKETSPPTTSCLDDFDARMRTQMLSKLRRTIFLAANIRKEYSRLRVPFLQATSNISFRFR